LNAKRNMRHRETWSCPQTPRSLLLAPPPGNLLGFLPNGSLAQHFTCKFFLAHAMIPALIIWNFWMGPWGKKPRMASNMKQPLREEPLTWWRLYSIASAVFLQGSSWAVLNNGKKGAVYRTNWKWDSTCICRIHGQSLLWLHLCLSLLQT